MEEAKVDHPALVQADVEGLAEAVGHGDGYDLEEILRVVEAHQVPAGRDGGLSAIGRWFPDVVPQVALRLGLQRPRGGVEGQHRELGASGRQQQPVAPAGVRMVHVDGCDFGVEVDVKHGLQAVRSHTQNLQSCGLGDDEVEIVRPRERGSHRRRHGRRFLGAGDVVERHGRRARE